MYQYYQCSHIQYDIDIVMITYNHEQYIEQALESVLNQQTKYSYRILIGEDCSTDKTRQIVMSYYKKYPDKIGLLLWNQNMGSRKNTCQMMKLSDAKYLAILEGDDYWTDSFKLQKQVDFLENHGNYIATAHNVRCVNEDGRLLHRDFGAYPIREEHIYGKREALDFKLVGHISSVVFRNFMKKWSNDQIDKFWNNTANGDIKISVFLGLQGDVFCFRDIMSDHRRVFVGDSWTAKAVGKNLLWFTYVSDKIIADIAHEILEEQESFSLPLDPLLELSKEKLLLNFNRQNLKVYMYLMLEKYDIFCRMKHFVKKI